VGAWTVYVIRCADDSLYTGVATDLAARLRRHACGKGSRYVRSKRPFRLVYREAHADRSSALRREAEIKSWPRRKKLEAIRTAGKKR
jgi:putative endonuclease